MSAVQQRKKPAVRAFQSRSVGMPHDPEDAQPAVIQQPAKAVLRPVDVVNNLIDAVAAAGTDEKVKQAVRDAFTPPAVKRRRGRPRIHVSDAERKRAERAKAAARLEVILGHFELTLDTAIPQALKMTYGIPCDTYRTLLRESRYEARAIKEITRELQMLGKVKPSGSGNGRYMTDAPAGRGELVVLAKPGKARDDARARERGLSKPGDFEPELRDEVLEESMNDRRRKVPEGAGPDEVEDTE